MNSEYPTPKSLQDSILNWEYAAPKSLQNSAFGIQCSILIKDPGRCLQNPSIPI
jgi:hypothetical protein